MRIWTEEQRRAASERMKAHWSDPVVRAAHSLAAKKPAICEGCGENDLSKFYKDKKGRRSNAKCKECHKAECKKRWHSKTATEKHASRVHSLYGLTPTEYFEMHETQGGLCAICKQAPTTKRGLHVDHCHKTNKVRGLLCHGCNTGIGAMQENPKIFTNAIAYLGG